MWIVSWSREANCRVQSPPDGGRLVNNPNSQLRLQAGLDPKSKYTPRARLNQKCNSNKARNSTQTGPRWSVHTLFTSQEKIKSFMKKDTIQNLLALNTYCPGLNKKFQACQETRPNVQKQREEKNRLSVIQILKSSDRDFKIAIINMFKKEQMKISQENGNIFLKNHIDS